jgi:WXG100 family type VII secretion target
VTGEILFSSAAVDDLSDALLRASQGIREILTRLESKLAGVEWDGRAEQSYRDAQAQWSSVMEDMADMLRVAKDAADSASANLSDAESTVAALWAKG